MAPWLKIKSTPNYRSNQIHKLVTCLLFVLVWLKFVFLCVSLTGYGQHPDHCASHRIDDPDGRGPCTHAPPWLRTGGRRQHGYTRHAGELYRHTEVQCDEEHEKGAEICSTRTFQYVWPNKDFISLDSSCFWHLVCTVVVLNQACTCSSCHTNTVTILNVFGSKKAPKKWEDTSLLWWAKVFFYPYVPSEVKGFFYLFIFLWLRGREKAWCYKGDYRNPIWIWSKMTSESDF